MITSLGTLLCGLVFVLIGICYKNIEWRDNIKPKDQKKFFIVIGTAMIFVSIARIGLELLTDK
ncbi:MAG: hypothetical protein Ta2F_17400 [Termitinemataceae bacterium]|nr:MAG: hypothetical protein Ta2F_17400 [Termitinemataceae bacterium]